LIALDIVACIAHGENLTVIWFSQERRFSTRFVGDDRKWSLSLDSTRNTSMSKGERLG